MKIGLFDSGLGGLVTLKNVRKLLTDYDYFYYGDTENMPYGERSSGEVLELTKKGINFLFDRGCILVILACNTASADALRVIQQQYIPKSKYAGRKVLGVIRPIAETAAEGNKIGVLATTGTVKSGAYPKEILKITPNAQVIQVAAFEVAPLVEAGNLLLAGDFLKAYAERLVKKGVDTLVLGCTHYPMVRSSLKELEKTLRVVDQTDVLPNKLVDYLARHQEIASGLSKSRAVQIHITKRNQYIVNKIQEWFGDGGCNFELE